MFYISTKMNKITGHLMGVESTSLCAPLWYSTTQRMDGCMDGYMDGWVNGWMHELVHGCMDEGCMNGQTHGRWINICYVFFM